MSARLTLERGAWYGWTMWPGYGGNPYHSPIRVNAVTPLHTSKRLFDLYFFNMGYAAGVQMMTYRLVTLRRKQSYMLAAQEGSDRSVAIVELDPFWIMTHLPALTPRIERIMEETGSFVDAMDQLAGVQHWDRRL
jgi:hypothetical protein